MTTVPLAAIGVVLAIRLRNIPVNIAVMIGMMTVGGIVVNNAIILVDHINRLRKVGLSKFRALIQSGLDRMRPILMTTITTALALFPTALDRSPEGVVFWSPFAITVVSGLLFSTMLTLFMVPSVYLILEDVRRFLFRRWKHGRF
jgi:HAE1 family hydrophobic/amphiphilic exporter-1